MTVLENFTFFNGATATGNSPVLVNTRGDALTLMVSGTFVGTIVVKGGLESAEATITVIDMSDFSFADSITKAGAFTVPSAYGYDKISLTISSYTSGSITVVGRLCEA